MYAMDRTTHLEHHTDRWSRRRRRALTLVTPTQEPDAPDTPDSTARSEPDASPVHEFID